MTIIPSPKLLQAMGLKPLAADQQIKARFYSTHLYTIEGIGIDKGTGHTASGTVDGEAYGIAVAGSLKTLAQLTGHVMTNVDEGKWEKENQCSPPYAIIQIGPTSEHSARVHHLQEHGATLETCDAFPAAREELESLESRAYCRQY